MIEYFNKITNFKKDIEDVCIKHGLCVCLEDENVIIRSFGDDNEIIKDAFVDHKIFENEIPS